MCDAVRRVDNKLKDTYISVHSANGLQQMPLDTISTSNGEESTSL